HNPEIDWNTGHFSLSHCPEEEEVQGRKAMVEEIEDKDSPERWIHYKASVAMEQKVAEEATKKKQTVEEMVPSWLHDYLGVFSEEESKHFPERKKWDHAIDLKD
ncbi:hypothetical protein BDR03DRAFT_836461, partial [Suillus americanus]